MLNEARLRKIIRIDLESDQSPDGPNVSLQELVERYQAHTALLRGTVALIVIEECHRLGITVAKI